MLVSQKIYGAYMKLPTQRTQLHESISNNNNLYPYFRDCISAINETHLPAFVSEDEHAPFCNCKGVISQNMLAACSFDFKFVYILSGWEGSTSDSLMYQDTRVTDFKILKGKYYLVNAGYPNTDSLKVPY
jgi:hypothetical protein